MSVLQIWTAAIETCQAVSIQKGATSANAWRATQETGSIATVWECVRAVLPLGGCGRRNEQETQFMIWGRSASSRGADSWPWWSVLSLFEILVRAGILTVAPPDSWHLAFLSFWSSPSCLKHGNLSNWSIFQASICQWILSLHVCPLFSSYSRRERMSEEEEGNGGEPVELYWKSLPWI